MNLYVNILRVLHREFEMSLMEELTYFLGLQIKQVEEGTFISQTKYCLELLKKFDMKDSKIISTPTTLNVLIDKDERGVDFDVTRYQASPKDPHFKIVKRILRYLNRTFHHSFWYHKGSACSLVGYSDSDFAGWKSDRRSTSGTCHLFRSCLVFWHSKKHHSVLLSTVDDEYVVAGSCYA
ncbi:secreted RxLR effector protein 161 [Lathyrus oleraceus]|uniref:secreted RxLR effector protein 161 n=1 Tax=Pisum sativum TaxID=3888 RepID=UPI0021D212C3|nr:secreted RxLR effector protein 161-like [Pisum sativum]